MDDAPPRPIALIYPSRSGGAGHVVIRLDYDPPMVVCTCKAMRNIANRPQGCWAMSAARQVMGIADATSN